MTFNYDDEKHVLTVTDDDGAITKYVFNDDWRLGHFLGMIFSQLSDSSSSSSGSATEGVDVETWAVSGSEETIPDSKLSENIATVTYVTEALEGYATEEYVSEAILGVASGDIDTSNFVMQSDLEDYATKTYVEEAVASVTSETVDLSDYATKEYVEEKVGSVEVDMTGVVTETQLENTLAGYYTSDEVDEIVSDVEEKIPSTEDFLTSTDLEGYATESYVSEKIAEASLEGGEVDLSAYATKEYVAEAVEGVTVDLTGYATEAYVDEKIAEAQLDGAEIDLSAYATKEFVEEQIAGIEVPSIEGLATEEYVDNKIDAIEIPTTNLSDYYTSTEVDSLVAAVRDEIPSTEGLATETYVDEKVGAIEIPDTSNFTTQSISSDTGTAYVWNESSGGGARFVHTDGTESFIGVNNGGESGMVAQVYADKALSEGGYEGTVLNVYKKGIFYHANRVTTDVTYSSDNPDNELAVKGDIPSLEGYATEAYVAEEIAKVQSGGEIDLSSYATTEYVDEKVANIEHPTTDLSGYYTKEETDAIASEVEAKIPTNYTVQSIVGENGTSYIWNESSGGGARFENNDGTTSFVGVNGYGTGTPTAQIYSMDSENNVTRLNVFTKGIFYHGNRSRSDAEYVMDDPDYEVAIKKDIPSVEGLATESYVNEKIDAIEHPTVDLSSYATTEYVDGKDAEIEAKIPTNYVTQSIASDTGTAYIWNETSGGGARYDHADGSRSFVGVNNGGADDIAVQVYAKNNSTNVGTRINVYNKGAYYIPNMSNSDAEYQADGEKYEIAVKGDIPSLEGYATEAYVQSLIEDLQNQISELRQAIEDLT